jgi:hypothetical protein
VLAEPTAHARDPPAGRRGAIGRPRAPARGGRNPLASNRPLPPRAGIAFRFDDDPVAHTTGGCRNPVSPGNQPIREGGHAVTSSNCAERLRRATVRASQARRGAAWGPRCSSLRTGSRGEGSSLGSLASACAVSQHPAVTGIEAEPAPPKGVPQARVAMPSALFGRLVISWESPGLPRPTRSPGRSSAGTVAMPPSPGSSSAERTGARPSPVLLVCSSRLRSPSPVWDAMAPCSGRVGLPICICGRVALPGEREPPIECERAGTEVRTAKEGGRRCRRSGRRRMRRQARRARRGSRSRSRRPRAGEVAAAGSTERRVQRGVQSVWAGTRPLGAGSVGRRCV